MYSLIYIAHKDYITYKILEKNIMKNKTKINCNVTKRRTFRIYKAQNLLM